MSWDSTGPTAAPAHTNSTGIEDIDERPPGGGAKLARGLVVLNDAVNI